MRDVPVEVRALVEARDEARAAKDFARADVLRAEIEGAGYVLKDTPNGIHLTKAATYEPVDARRIPNTLADPPTLDLSIHLLYEGFLDDVHRFIRGLNAHADLSSTEIVVVDNASPDGDALERLDPPMRILHLEQEAGWAAARNTGLKTSKGRILALADLSIEPTGDIVTPLVRAFDDPSVGAAGPFGLTSDDMRAWHPDDGPEVLALEGYLLATRREILAEQLINEKFRWYRNADIDLSFQIRSMGYRAVVVPLPFAKHVHRGWTALEGDHAERDKRSKRNHYVFFDRWKHRTDLLGVRKDTI